MDPKKLKKEFTHKSKEICRICEKEINTIFDEWAVIVDYEAEDQTGKGFYHRKCLNDLIKGQAELIQQQFKEKLTDFARSMITGIKN